MRTLHLPVVFAAVIGIVCCGHDAAAQALPAAAVAAPAPVEIPAGVIYGKFEKSDGPFLLTGSVIVPAGQILEFGPGCEILVGGKYSTITVFGQLLAQGTSQEPVVFRSAKTVPNPWDWDRIYIRSRTRSVLDNVVVRHSNYGVCVENASVTISNSLFEQNSLSAIAVRNASVKIEKVTIKRGHVTGILCQAGASVTADSLVVRDNGTAVCVDAQAAYSQTGGLLTGNTIGVAVRKGSMVSIVAADITKNRTGVATMQEIPRKMTEMIYGNDLDVKPVTAAEMDKLIKAPLSVKSVALPQSTNETTAPEGFAAGFSAVAQPREATASLIGNVGLGTRYFRTHSTDNPADNVRILQNKYIGEEPVSKGLQPEMSIFLQGKNNAADVSFNADLSGNDWVDRPLHMRTNQMTLAVTAGPLNAMVGDFYENFSEISANNRKLRGGRFSGGLINRGRGEKLLNFHLAAGESEHTADAGSHNLDAIGDTVASGASVRQQMTYVAQLGVKPTQTVSFGAKGLIARDQADRGIFSDALQDTASPRALVSQTGCLDLGLDLLGGKLAIATELGMGARDTVDSADVGEIVWSNPKIFGSIGRVFEVIRPDSDNYAINVSAKWTPGPVDISADFQQVAKNYASAGNPYVESDRRQAALRGEKQFGEALTLKGGYSFAQSGFSLNLTTDDRSPVVYHTLSANGEAALGAGLPALTLDWEGKLQTEDKSGLDVVDSAMVDYSTREITNAASLDVKQRFEKGVDYSIRYAVTRKNDHTDYPDTADLDRNDQWENGITLRFNAKITKIIVNKATVGLTLRKRGPADDSLLREVRKDLKLSDNIRVTIIPRKLILSLKGDWQLRATEKLNDSGTARITEERDFRNVEGELKYAITSKLSAILSARYEKSSDGAVGSRENYSMKTGGLHFTYLF